MECRNNMPGFQSGVWKLAENSLRRRNEVTGPHTGINSRQKEERNRGAKGKKKNIFGCGDFYH